jgi:hypothetical protein
MIRLGIPHNSKVTDSSLLNRRPPLGARLVAMLHTVQSPRGDYYPGAYINYLISKNFYLHTLQLMAERLYGGKTV